VSDPVVPVPERSGQPQRAAYREALLPSLPVWVAVLAVSACLGLTAMRPLGAGGGGLVALLAVAVAAVALVLSSARVEVGDGWLRAGRARIEVQHLGRVAVVPARRMAALRGRDADARAYLCQRPWNP